MGKIVDFEITFDCPVCGESVPAGAKSCPECGACEKSGWSENTPYDALDLPDYAYEDEKVVGVKFKEPGKGMQRWWPLVALILLIAMLLPMLHSCAH